VWQLRDGLNIRNIIITAGENDGKIHLREGMDGNLLKTIDASYSGIRYEIISFKRKKINLLHKFIRWRSLACYAGNIKGDVSRKRTMVSPYIFYGSKNGTIFIYGLDT
jgi:hypothetical protein